MRSERSPSAGTARRTTFNADEVVKTFFNGWATKEHWMSTLSPPHSDRRASGYCPLATGDGAA